MKKIKVWDQKEEKLLTELYSVKTNEELCILFKRSIKSISRKAEELSLLKTEDTKWRTMSIATKRKWERGIFNKEEARERFLLMIKNRDQTKEKNPNWKGDNRKTIEHRDRDCIEYKTWRKKVFSRDNFVCQLCYNRGGYLEAHHIRSFKEYKKLRYRTDNGITLCRKCHKSIRKTEYLYEKAFKEYIKLLKNKI